MMPLGLNTPGARCGGGAVADGGPVTAGLRATTGGIAPPSLLRDFAIDKVLLLPLLTTTMPKTGRVTCAL